MRARLTGLLVAALGLMLAAVVAVPASAQNFRGDAQSVDWGPVEFTVEIHESPVTRLRVTGKVANTGHQVLQNVRIPMCLAWIRIYEGSSMIWSNADQEMCDGLPRPITLAPGETRTDTYSYNVDEILTGNTPSGDYRIAFYIPRLSWPGQPPRTEMEVNLGTITLKHPTETRPAELNSTLIVPELPWGSSLEKVEEKFTREGFQVARHGLEGSLYFNGSDFLGRNAGIIARPYRDQLVKVVAMMEPNEGEKLPETFTHVRQKLVGVFGQPDKVRPGPEGHQEVFWRQTNADGQVSVLHLHIYTDRPEPVVRADFQGPRWEQAAREMAQFGS